MSSTSFDWPALEAHAVTYMVAAVSQIHQQHPTEQLYGAMFHAFYGDGTVISWPCVAVGTEESLGEDAESDELRWSPADLPHCIEPDEEEDRWAAACCEFAARKGTFTEWEKVYQRFLHVFPRAAKKARKQLLQAGIIDKSFLTLAADEAGDLIPLSLTKAQISRHFPQYDAAGQERQRLAALPVAQRVAELVPLAVSAVEPGALYGEYGEMVKALAELAVPPLAAVVRGDAPGDDWQACMLLAEINIASEEAVAALTMLMENPNARISSRSWAAAALARLGKMDVLASRLTTLPEDVIASGLAGPYRSFRDRGRYLPLDYQPLEQVLDHYPHIEAAVAEELTPGSGFCRINKGEVAAARLGLNSRWPLIRQHASAILEDFEDKL